ncbi:MAG: type III pantothenate kinase [Winogradskyella sp.]|uniref:type III pantothenate kinase n=1 Tax=Winogradskyella sp. TaxID=1883156 RepID=UPI0025F63B7A|nr:type III pantothenate kinase [Winogradskyella sp.]NRB83962.1 type III pantothenate kinase [Winogradskyella sp.]
MNLIIDVGNSFVKFAVFKNNALLHKESFELFKFKKRYKALRENFKNIDCCIISSVGRLTDEQIHYVDDELEVLKLSINTKLPFKNLYQTPKTLGVDRIALVSASVNQFPDNNVLIIDAGTCITYDFVTDKNEYLGGAISPGIRLRYEALHNFTANLPLLEKDQPKTITGDTTESSIHSGVTMGVIKEIDGVIDEYRENHQDLTVILTGGDANFLSNQLKNSIFANSNFLLEGLNFILDFNSK